jgi:hypothetical protein
METAAPVLRRHRSPRRAAATLALVVGVLAFALAAHAGPREQARRMHDRLVGVPPSPAVLDEMEGLIAGGSAVQAARVAMQNPVFYTTTLKNFATPWTNEARTVHAPLNDYSATVIGIVRDDLAFTMALSGDLVYVGAPGTTSTPYSHTDNRHYEELEDRRADLSDPDVLTAVSQSGLPGAVLQSSQTAGVLTTRAAGEAFFKAGTNRRMWWGTAINHLCRDMPELNDVTRPTDRIRQDVSRSPGGDSSLFLNQCSGCHAGMDGLAGAFAYYQWDDELERVVYTSGQVQPKNLINANAFPSGYVTVDDSWINYWRSGPNASLGWSDALPGAGQGAKSLGEEVASTRAFAVCQVEKAFRHVCLRGVSSQADRDAVERIADAFQSNGYRMKRVFAEVAVTCMGD